MCASRTYSFVALTINLFGIYILQFRWSTWLEKFPRPRFDVSSTRLSVTEKIPPSVTVREKAHLAPRNRPERVGHPYKNSSLTNEADLKGSANAVARCAPESIWQHSEYTQR